MINWLLGKMGYVLICKSEHRDLGNKASLAREYEWWMRDVLGVEVPTSYQMSSKAIELAWRNKKPLLGDSIFNGKSMLETLKEGAKVQNG